MSKFHTKIHTKGHSMRKTFRTAAPLAALLLLAGACDEEATDATTASEETDTDTEETGATDDDGGDEHAEATFNGEEIAFTGVSCGTLPAGETYEIRGRVDGGGHLQARFSYDAEASDGDDIVLASDTPSRIELFFMGEGGTIGDGEGFRASGEDIAELDASSDHISGSAHLEPESDTQAVETTPDGGEIEFDLRCG